jgi:hypothetical protein
LGLPLFGRPGLNVATPLTDWQVVPPTAPAGTAVTAPVISVRAATNKILAALLRMM